MANGTALMAPIARPRTGLPLPLRILCTMSRTPNQNHQTRLKTNQIVATTRCWAAVCTIMSVKLVAFLNAVAILIEMLGTELEDVRVALQAGETVDHSGL